jgi:hypothetical protein
MLGERIGAGKQSSSGRALMWTEAINGLIRHRWLLIYMSLYVWIVVWILPPGEEYLSDDGDYALTVFDWVETGRLRLTDFPSMTLVGHLAWGWLFAFIFGLSPIVLKASTMVMAWIGAFAIYDLVARFNKEHRFAALAAACYVFNPLVFYYSYTFNTDVGGTSLITVFLAFANRMRDRRSFVGAMVLGGFAAYSYLTRQTAGVPGILLGAIFVWLLIHRTIRVQSLLVYALSFVLPIVGYFAWLAYDYGWPIGYEKGFVSTRVLFDCKIALVKAIRMTMALGMYLLPVLIAWLFQSMTKSSHRFMILGLAVAFSACSFVGSSLTVLRPFWNIDLVEGGYWKDLAVDYSAEPRLVQQIGRQQVLFTVFEYGSVLAGLLGFFIAIYAAWTYRKLWLHPSKLAWIPTDLDVRWLAGLTLIVQFGLGLMVWDYFDRYLMPAIGVGLFLSVYCLKGRQGFVVGNLLMLVVAVISVAGMQDSLVEAKARWSLAKSLESRGVAPNDIWIGFQYYVAKGYGPMIRDELTKHGNKLKNIDRNQRAELGRWNRKAAFQVRSVPTRQTLSEEWPSIECSSWLREYRYEVFYEEQ